MTLHFLIWGMGLKLPVLLGGGESHLRQIHLLAAVAAVVCGVRKEEMSISPEWDGIS